MNSHRMHVLELPRIDLAVCRMSIKAKKEFIPDPRLTTCLKNEYNKAIIGSTELHSPSNLKYCNQLRNSERLQLVRSLNFRRNIITTFDESLSRERVPANVPSRNSCRQFSRLKQICQHKIEKSWKLTMAENSDHGIEQRAHEDGPEYRSMAVEPSAMLGMGRLHHALLPKFHKPNTVSSQSKTSSSSHRRWEVRELSALPADYTLVATNVFVKDGSSAQVIADRICKALKVFLISIDSKNSEEVRRQ